MKKINLVIVLGCLILSSCRQDLDWVMVYEMGKPSPKADLNDTTMVLRSFDVLNADLHQLTVEGESFVRLTDPDGTLSDFGPGKYNFKQISKLFYKQSAHHKPLPKKYVDYIWTQMSHKEHESTVNTKATVLRNLPKAYRGKDFVVSPQNLEIVNDKNITFSWHSFKPNGEYLMFVRQVDGDWNKAIQTSDTTYTLNGEAFENESFYSFKVEGGGPEREFFLQYEE